MEKQVKTSQGFYFKDTRIPKGTLLTINELVDIPTSKSGKAFVVSDTPYSYREMIDTPLDIGLIERGHSIVKEFEANEFIKKSDLQLWQVFTNNNNHLSIVYAITKTKYYIYNYNGSSYPINREDTSLTNYRKSTLTADDFFKNYPRIRIDNWIKITEYTNIKNRYLGNNIDFTTFVEPITETNSKYKLLLII